MGARSTASPGSIRMSIQHTAVRYDRFTGEVGTSSPYSQLLYSVANESRSDTVMENALFRSTRSPLCSNPARTSNVDPSRKRSPPSRSKRSIVSNSSCPVSSPRSR
ncbi:hypothetical protein [Streptomyces sp. NPDC005784]|uniref:hypothetical protein n=1 Tax=Streptomyces sp. NPDC005784 TaxID=3364731 RepID=UPI003675C9B4